MIMPQAEFERRVRETGLDVDLSRALYQGAWVKVEAVCPRHGAWMSNPSNLMRGHGCGICARERRGQKRRVTPEQYVARARVVHGDLYDYTKTQYVTMHQPITVECRQHGLFQQSPIHHLAGQGCPICGAAKRGFRRDVAAASKKSANSKVLRFSSQFAASAQQVHGDRYDYAEFVYGGAKTKGVIVCRKHGRFEQMPDKHLAGKGCPVCSHHVSKGEDEVMALVKGWGFEAIRRDRAAIKPMELDIYIPEKQLAIEYCGMYWHSTASLEEAQARHKHVDKFKACADAGIRLITLYQSEWDSRGAVVAKTLAHALGRSGAAVPARKCEIVQLGTEQAKEFLRANHLQRAPASGRHYGLRHGDGLVAVMTFAMAASQRGGSQWELLRFATSCPVPGGASRLFKAFVDDVRPEQVVSFSDNRWFDGRLYATLGFHLDGDVAPDYAVWDQRFGCRHKSLYKRKLLPARLREAKMDEHFAPATDPRTEFQIEDLLGAGRIYDCGKKRWLWKQENPPAL